MNPVIVQLLRQEQQLAYLLTDQDLNLVEITPEAAARLDLDPTTVLGQSLGQVLPEAIGLEAILHDLVLQRLSRYELNWINRESRSKQPVYLNLKFYSLPGKEATGLALFIEDVTELGQARQALTQHRNELRLLGDQLIKQNEALAKANAELRHLDDLKSTFISVAAHELQTPLSAIIGFIEAMEDEVYGAITAKQHEILQIMQGSTDRLFNIVKNLLDVTRIETGRLELHLEPTHLPYLINTAVAELKSQVEAKGQTLALEIEPALPFVTCDPNRTVQIISNLLSNAIKYTPNHGQIRIKAEHSPADRAVQISVIDNGVGIAKHDQVHLFKRFFRAASAAQIQASGTGLGLFITQSLVEMQGGQIWAESELNQGSTFHVTFPLNGLTNQPRKSLRSLA
jgi:signal transduction histidine kinase